MMGWIVELAMASPFSVFILICATYYTLKWIIFLPPKLIQAFAEAMCEHTWCLERSGPVVANMGEADEMCVGRYSLYRCDKCGASRDYR